MGYRRRYNRVIRQRDSPSLSKTTTEKNRSSTIHRPLLETREGRICRRRSEKKTNSLLRIPQAGIVSPILSNVYLHEFDLFIEKLISIQHSTAKDITKKPEYDKITRRIQYLRDKFPKIENRSA